MGIFDIFKKKDTTPEAAASSPKKEGTSQGVSLSKKLDLRKEKVGISLAKKNVQSLVAEVFVCMDSSGSMSQLYKNGTVQETLERLIPISLKFDDDGKIPFYTFSTDCAEQPVLTLNNLEGYTKAFLSKAVGGGTKYSPPINKIVKKAKNGELSNPAFVIFITDGENSDKAETKKALVAASEYDIYFQFVGIGNERFTFLRELDNLTGRKFDNAGFIPIKDMARVSEEELYDKLIDEFVDIYKKNTFKSGKISLVK